MNQALVAGIEQRVERARENAKAGDESAAHYLIDVRRLLEDRMLLVACIRDLTEFVGGHPKAPWVFGGAVTRETLERCNADPSGPHFNLECMSCGANVTDDRPHLAWETLQRARAIIDR